MRKKRTPEAPAELEAAARLAPENARYGDVYAVALHETGAPAAAPEALARVLVRHPYDRDALGAAMTCALDQNDAAQTRRLPELEPSNADARRIVERLGASRGR